MRKYLQYAEIFCLSKPVRTCKWVLKTPNHNKASALAVCRNDLETVDPEQSPSDPGPHFLSLYMYLQISHSQGKLCRCLLLHV